MKTELKQFTKEDKTWVDDNGIPIPFTRIKKSEKLREKEAYRIALDSFKIQEALKAHKEKIERITKEVFEIIAEENEVKRDTKGNFTWFNFNRTIKVETNINERIEFDGSLIEMCKAKLNEFIDKNLSGVDELVKNLVNDAFQTSRGRLDHKKVLSLLKYRHKIKAKDFNEALDLLEKAIMRSGSKQYFRVAVKDASGEWKYIDLNFSSL